MKHRILFGIMALVMGVFMAGCSDDEYGINSTPLLTDDSVQTGSADVTATTATLHGSVAGLAEQSTSAYTVGFNYGTAADNLSESVKGSSAAEFTATISGETGTTYYYQAYVTLQDKVTYTGEVKSCVLTTATAETGASSDVTANTAKLSATLTNYDTVDGATAGVIVSGVGGSDTQDNIELVRNGVRIEGETAASLSVTAKGLLPNTTYYYCAYIDLGNGVVYGEVKSFTTKSQTFDVDNDLVDLGLSVKWAKYNIGASTETELGGLFGFGDLTGYNTSVDPADYASADIYQKEATDLAYRCYQGKAMLPSADEYEELFRCCTQEETTIDGVKGMKFTGTNGNSIFLPYAGSRTQNTYTGEGTTGYYMTGSINPNDTEYALSYQFNANYNGRMSKPVYTAMSLRAVSTAKNVPFDKTLLYQKWYLENNQDGKLHVFNGPFHQYSVNDTWGTITNNELRMFDVIDWDMGLTNEWFGYTAGKDYGYMEFREDGTFVVVDADGNTTREGKFTIDEENKTITVDENVLAADNTWVTQNGTLNILSLTANQLQISLPNGIYGYAAQYYSETKKAADEEIEVSVSCTALWWSAQWTGTDKIAPDMLDGQHTITLSQGWGTIDNAFIFYMDFTGLLKKFPNAMVRIDDIKCDGSSIKFDANNFYYGDIENNGNYRVELFNIYGKEANGNGQMVLKSPFSSKTNVQSDDAFSFSESCEITYTIITDAQFPMTFTPNLITVADSWGDQNWGTNQGSTITIDLVDNKYVINNNEQSIKYESTGSSAGLIMAFVQIDNLMTYFPKTHATLDECLLDGKAVSYDKSKVIDSSEDAKYRLELWNCYGATKSSGCGFGTPVGDTVKELGFSSSIELNYTVQSLFTVPEW